MLFTYKQISSLNETETYIYQYVIKNIDNVVKMSVRDLAAATHVSTASIVRFCKKTGCRGYVEFRMKLEEFQQGMKLPDIDDEIDNIMEFFEYARSEKFQRKIDEFVSYVQQADTIIFLGIGTSGLLGKFGARYFSNVGYFSQSIDDPYYPPPCSESKNNLCIVLSESGETREVIDQIKMYQSIQMKIVTITNKKGTTIDRMADLSIHYYVKDIVLPQTYNVSTQIPVMYILERVTRKLQNNKEKSLPLKYTSRNI